MRKRSVVAGLGLAGLLGIFAVGGSDPVPTTAALSAERSAGLGRLRLRSGGDASTAEAAPMPPQDARIDAFLAEHTLDDELRDRLVDLARQQRVTYAPRPPGARETAEARAARRARREEFRARVRDLVAAMPDETRAAMRRHKINLVRLAQALEAKPSEGVRP